ncbi:hypothetical protein [Olivibacter sp. XZL3]|uniref:hypothetical protein n=1 Tax=Olivibacter sp. XZL3 TaxID=1735116 RepID=UPI001066C58C|nr:hypothetical protein [Olivibacter sp. XZL3]
MNRFVFVLFFLWSAKAAFTQEIDADLLAVKKKIDAVQQFSATVIFDLEVPFIRMPTKSAKISYARGEKMQFSSSDFVMLPKRGLDFSMSEIFEYPFITVERGIKKKDGLLLKVLNVIPTDTRSDLAMATLYMDTKANRIVESEINTRKDGSYVLSMQYASERDILPNYVETTFAIERLKIPFNFMGKDTQIDRKKMKETETKTGKIKMQIKDYSVKKD